MKGAQHRKQQLKTTVGNCHPLLNLPCKSCAKSKHMKSAAQVNRTRHPAFVPQSMPQRLTLNPCFPPLPPDSGRYLLNLKRCKSVSSEGPQTLAFNPNSRRNRAHAYPGRESRLRSLEKLRHHILKGARCVNQHSSVCVGICN